MNINRRSFLEWLGIAPVAYSFLGKGIWTPPKKEIEVVHDMIDLDIDEFYSVTIDTECEAISTTNKHWLGSSKANSPRYSMAMELSPESAERLYQQLKQQRDRALRLHVDLP